MEVSPSAGVCHGISVSYVLCCLQPEQCLVSHQLWMPLCRYVLNAFPAPFRFFLTLQSPQLCKELAHHPFRLEAQACIGVPNACGVSVCVVVSPRYVLASHGHAQITWPKVCSRVRHALVPRIMHGHASACGVHDGVPKALPCTNHCTVYFLHPSETVGTMYTLYLGLHYSRDRKSVV